MVEQDDKTPDLLDLWEQFEQRFGFRNYILDENRKPVAVSLRDHTKWWCGNPQIHVGDTYLTGDVRVSTVFLISDHSYRREGPPVLFETAIFRPNVEIIDRYTTWEDAEIGHRATVERLCKEEGRTIETEDPLNAEYIL